MADWSKIIACEACGKGNPSDAQVCLKCSHHLGTPYKSATTTQQIIVPRHRLWLERAHVVGFFCMPIGFVLFLLGSLSREKPSNWYWVSRFSLTGQKEQIWEPGAVGTFIMVAGLVLCFSGGIIASICQRLLRRRRHTAGEQ
jgi:hypothetical protein